MVDAFAVRGPDGAAGLVQFPLLILLHCSAKYGRLLVGAGLKS